MEAKLIKELNGLVAQHANIFDYYFPIPYYVMDNSEEEIDKFRKLIQKSIEEGVDYLIGNYGITKELLKHMKKYPDDIIWD